MNDDDAPSDDPPEDDEHLPAEQRTVDASSKREHRKRIRKQKFSAQEADRFWALVFDTPIGRREMWGLLQAAHTFETQFPAGTVGFPDPNAAWYARGEQDYGSRLHRAWMLRCPAQVILMHQENDPQFRKANPIVRSAGD